MPMKYVPFVPEPIEGQAVLSNFNRILKYRGADDVSMVYNGECHFMRWRRKKLSAKVAAAIWLFGENVYRRALI